MDIQLNNEATERLKRFKTIFKDRGLKAHDWSEIVSQIILRLNDASWQYLIDLQTPEEYLIKRSLNDPSSRKALLDFIKKLHKVPKKSTKKGSLAIEISPDDPSQSARS